MRVPFFPSSLPTSFGGVFAHSYYNRSEVNLGVVSICISFVTRDGEHFFMCFLAIWISSFEKVLLFTSLLAH
jgi:hypothetical protein